MKMKKQEVKELLGLGDAAISGKIAELQKEIAKATLDLKRCKLKNLRERKGMRRIIAVLKTKASQGVK